jgi:hypothetical protein
VPRDVAESGYSDEETDRLQLVGGDGFLSPGGSAAVTFQGLANLATINESHITQLRATQAGGTLVARYPPR